MRRLKAALIGNFVAEPRVTALPADRRAVRRLLTFKNYTRVVTPDAAVMEHLAFLKRELDLPRSQKLSVWEMNLCSVLLLASHLERLGVETLPINYIDTDNQEEKLAEIRDFAPDMLLVSTTFVLSGSDFLEIGRRLREHFPAVFLVAGGHHVFTTLLYMDAAERRAFLESSPFDALVNDAQGEASLAELCRSFRGSLSGVPNLLWRSPDGQVSENPRQVENNDVNSTPIRLGPLPEGSVVHLRTARSCSFKCAFCSYPTIAGGLALMDLDHVMATLQQCRERGVAAVFFVDDTFNVPRERFAELVDRMIEADLRIPWYSFLRCQFVDRQLVAKMRRSGCAGVFLGVESGSQKVLKNMRKGAKAEVYFNGIRWLKEEGIVTVGSFILGFPGETAESVQETREFIEESGLSYYYIQPFYYLHHTPVHERAEQYGLKGSGLFWSHDTMESGEALEHMHRLFLDIDNPIWVNPDHTLWEVAYLRSKGMEAAAIDSYRKKVNLMTAAQMAKYGIGSGAPAAVPAAG